MKVCFDPNDIMEIIAGMENSKQYIPNPAPTYIQFPMTNNQFNVISRGLFWTKTVPEWLMALVIWFTHIGFLPMVIGFLLVTLPVC